MAQPHHQGGGQYDEGYAHGQQPDGYYDENNQAYYDHNGQAGYAQQGEGYYDER